MKNQNDWTLADNSSFELASEEDAAAMLVYAEAGVSIEEARAVHSEGSIN